MRKTLRRIATYNIHTARGLDGRRNPARVLDVIDGLDANIVVLQEADKRLSRSKSALLKPMIVEHSEYCVVPVAQNEVSLGWHSNAIFGTQAYGSHETARLAT